MKVLPLHPTQTNINMLHSYQLKPVLLLSALFIFLQMQAQKYVGGDISLLPSYVENGAKYYEHGGNAIADPLAFFKAEGMNAMRVRLFHTPANASTTEKGEGVKQDLAYVTRLAKRIKEAGMKLMLDFHYSDSWADPAKQWLPKAWAGLSESDLQDSIYNYTKHALTTLTKAGAVPDFIQTGNEISYGMDWGTDAGNAKYCYPSSPAANWDRFAALLRRATAACREVCPAATIILHTERVSANTSLQKDNAGYAALANFYNKMQGYAIDYDIIGLSYYPYFHGALGELDGAVSQLEKRYPGKDIMLVETGYSYKYAMGGDYNYTATYPLTDAGQRAFTRDLIALLNTHERVTGLFWWFMEANECGLTWGVDNVTEHWYNASLFDNTTGRATSALSELKTFAGTSNGIATVSALKQPIPDNHWYSLTGMRLPARPTIGGIYIHGDRKMAVGKVDK